MKGRYFWEIATFKKFRIIFESDEIIVGADKKTKYKTFRKDTERIAFSKTEVLEKRLSDLTKNQSSEAEKDEKNNHRRRWGNRRFIGCEFA